MGFYGGSGIIYKEYGLRPLRDGREGAFACAGARGRGGRAGAGGLEAAPDGRGADGDPLDARGGRLRADR